MNRDATGEQRSKQEARLTRQLEERREQDRRGRRRHLRKVSVTIVVAGAAIAGVWLLARPDPELAGVSKGPNRGGGHVELATYESSTPTSGAHDAQAPTCRTYLEPLEPSLAVHALEHGSVILWYDAAQPELADALMTVAEEWDSHVIISANADLDTPIVATAWNRLKSYEPADPEINDFVRTYRRRGPESVACDR